MCRCLSASPPGRSGHIDTDYRVLPVNRDLHVAVATVPVACLAARIVITLGHQGNQAVLAVQPAPTPRPRHGTCRHFEFSAVTDGDDDLPALTAPTASGSGWAVPWKQ